MLDPEFLGNQGLILLTDLIKTITAIMLPAAIGLTALCVVTVVCGSVLGTPLTMGGVGLDIYKFINGDQSLADTLLHLGETALWSLAFFGLAKLVGAAFTAVKVLVQAVRAARIAEQDLRKANEVRQRMLALSDCLSKATGFAGATLTQTADTRWKPVSQAGLGTPLLARAEKPLNCPAFIALGHTGDQAPGASTTSRNSRTTTTRSRICSGRRSSSGRRPTFTRASSRPSSRTARWSSTSA
ncbi:hypothetical protein [Dactylosporangium sp. CA-233914]|uniref:hypothetical protein n=1 Tax=Dactylosporangium sp. CA-233914 TaxID=3239934 RepID=UPI003D8E015B